MLFEEEKDKVETEEVKEEEEEVLEPIPEEPKEEEPEVEEAPVEEEVKPVEEAAPVEEPSETEVSKQEVPAEPEVEAPKAKVYPSKYTEPYHRPEPRMKKPEGPNVCFFAEKSRADIMPDHVFYTGDDGLPYVDNDVMLVTDGMGGASGFRHIKFNRGLFEEDLVFDALFRDMYGPKEENPILNDYVIDSFAVVMSLRDLYDSGRTAVYRKSGHMGSRVASAVMLHQLLDQNVKNNVYALMDDAKKAWNNRNVSIYSQRINKAAETITETFRKEFHQAAANAELKMEGPNPGAQHLLGTTLCATFVKENKEAKEVDAFYLLAGDSIPFALDEEHGFYEVMAAQEGADGGMTNNVRANDEELFEKRKLPPFTFEPKFVTFKEPCILMNASDGVFDHFTRPFMLEKLILDCIIKANDYQEFSDIMHSFYVAAQTTDDSQTMAAKFFGFESYEEVKAFAQRRLDKLMAKYADEEKGGLKDFFDVDYEILVGNAAQEKKNNLGRLFQEINANPKVAEFYRVNVGEKDKYLKEIKLAVDVFKVALPKTKEQFNYYNSLLTSDSLKLPKKFIELTHVTMDALGKEMEYLDKCIQKANEEIPGLESELAHAYRSFGDEWRAKGIHAVDTLIDGKVYTKEEMAELFRKYNVSYSENGDDDESRLEERRAIQNQLAEEYDKDYNHLTR